MSLCVTDQKDTPATGYWRTKPVNSSQGIDRAIPPPSAGVPKSWRSVPYWPPTGPKRVVEHVRNLESSFSRWDKNMAPTSVRRSLAEVNFTVMLNISEINSPDST